MKENRDARIAALVEGSQGRDLDAHYLGYFECFNRGLFFEAHEVLEKLWLSHRHGPEHAFYQGLIQYAGAFVHLQKERLKSAASLFKLARTNLGKYPAIHGHLEVAKVLGEIEAWLERLAAGRFEVNPLTRTTAPQLHPLPRN